MAMNKEELLAAIRDNFSTLDYIRPSEIPNIDLYMDQVTTFMDKRLAKSRRYDNDKILTKTMINNYAKNDLLPPPVKKKYSKEHMLLLIFIYYFKNILSIGDIQKVLEPISSRFFPEGGSGIRLRGSVQPGEGADRPAAGGSAGEAFLRRKDVPGRGWRRSGSAAAVFLHLPHEL